MFVAGYTGDYGADNIDAIVIGVGRDNGTVMQAYRLDAKLPFDNTREYIVDLTIHGNTTYLLGMTDAYDPGNYDIAVANVTRIGVNETAEKLYIIGNPGIYEIPGSGGWRVGGESIVVDALGYVWFIGEYRGANGYNRTLVFRLTHNLSTIVFVKQLAPYTPEDEFYPTTIEIPEARAIAYVGGIGVNSLYNVRYGYIIRVHNDSTLSYTYTLRDDGWSKDVEITGMDIYLYQDTYRIRLVANVENIVSDSEIVFEEGLPPYSWSDYSCSIVDKTSEAMRYNITSIPTTPLPPPVNTNLENPGYNENIYLAILQEQQPPPPIPETYIQITVVAVIVSIVLGIQVKRLK